MMEPNKREIKKRIKDIEKAAQAQSSTDNQPFKIIWEGVEPGSPKDPNDDSKPGDWLVEWGPGDEIIKRRRGTDEEEQQRKVDQWNELMSRRKQESNDEPGN